MAAQAEFYRLLETFEARRKACVRRWWIALLVIGLVVAGCEYWLYVAEVEGAGVYAIPPFFAVFAVVISYVWITAGFKSDYKTSIIGPLLKEYGEGLTYEPNHGIDQFVYEASGLFHRQVDRYRSEDPNICFTKHFDKIVDTI